ncbi:hypothetical protein RJT34_30451 [Clitoria ternatea]|uniref:Uncharacterized protein n=1 Tax=Clitoria ternatea TaxID=43366 RepID=A0AAN9I425_CLITE
MNGILVTGNSDWPLGPDKRPHLSCRSHSKFFQGPPPLGTLVHHLFSKPMLFLSLRRLNLHPLNLAPGCPPGQLEY